METSARHAGQLGCDIDMPVRTYSLGMMVRLCFAVATSVHREILLMDEWLAGSDAGFLMKVHQQYAAAEAGERAHEPKWVSLGDCC